MTKDELKSQYIDRVSRGTQIVEALESNAAFQMILKDAEANIATIDKCWHLVPKGEEKKLDELRITKLASVSLLTILDSYRHDVEKCKQAITDLEEGLDGTDEDGE